MGKYVFLLGAVLGAILIGTEAAGSIKTGQWYNVTKSEFPAIKKKIISILKIRREPTYSFPTQILEAQKQVVAGANYKVKYEGGSTLSGPQLCNIYYKVRLPPLDTIIESLECQTDPNPTPPPPPPTTTTTAPPPWVPVPEWKWDQVTDDIDEIFRENLEPEGSYPAFIIGAWKRLGEDDYLVDYESVDGRFCEVQYTEPPPPFPKNIISLECSRTNRFPKIPK